MAKNLVLFPRPARDSFELAHKARKGIARQFEELWKQGWPLREYTKSVEGAPGIEGHWYEYVPSCYDGSVEVPLVVSFHAGHYFAAAQVFDTCWCEIAEREGFIVVFPEALAHGCFGSSDATRKLEPDHDDVRFVLALLDDLQQRYSIDASRLYLHGMSRGGVFAAELSYLFGSKFAGIGSSCSLTMSAILDTLEVEEGTDLAPLPIIQMRSTFDAVVPYREPNPSELVNKNRHFWMERNECEGMPELHIGSRELIAYYRGTKADYVLRESAFHNHYEAISDAEDCWSLFSTVRRAADGSIERIDGGLEFEPDVKAIALGDMSSHALVDGKLVSTGAMIRQYRDVNTRRRGGFQSPIWAEATARELDGKDMHVYYYAPVSFVGQVFGLEASVDLDRATVTMPDSSYVEFVRGSSAAIVGNRVRNMGQAARDVDGNLCIPIDWFAEFALGLCTAEKDGVLYIADHQVVLTSTFAAIIREIIGWGA